MNADPRRNQRILVAATEERARSIVSSLRQAGLRAFAFPTVRIERVANPSELDRALRDWQTYDWVIFTSPNGVRAATARSRELRLNLSTAPPKIASVGPATKASLEAEGLGVAAMPADFVTDAIPDVLGDVEGRRVLLLRSSLARQSLPDRLRMDGARVDEVDAYVAKPSTPHGPEIPPADDIDLVAFTSGSAVRNLIQLVPPEYAEALKSHAKAACIGPVTADTARACGFRVAIVAREHTAGGLVRAIQEASR